MHRWDTNSGINNSRHVDETLNVPRHRMKVSRPPSFSVSYVGGTLTLVASSEYSLPADLNLAPAAATRVAT